MDAILLADELRCKVSLGVFMVKSRENCPVWAIDHLGDFFGAECDAGQ
jgi:hypothetical protein